MNKGGKIRVGVVVISLLAVFVFVGFGSGVDLGLPAGSGAVQSWGGVADFTLLRNGCSSPVSCEAEFSVLPLVGLGVSSGSVLLGSDVVRGGVDGLEIFEKSCSEIPVYNTYSLCVPYNVTGYDVVNQSFYTVNYPNCTIAQGVHTGVRTSCSLSPLGVSVNFQSGGMKTFVVKGKVQPNTFADWKINFSGFSPAWAYWNTSGWDCYVNLSAYESKGLARTYAFVSRNFNPLVEWSTCAVPYNASIRLLEYLANGSYGEVTVQLSNVSVNASGFMNSFNLNWQSNFSAFENKSYALYAKYSSDPVGYVNPWVLATTLNDDLAAYRLNNSYYSFTIDDDTQLMKIQSIQDGTIVHQITGGSDTSIMGRTTDSAYANSVNQNDNHNLDGSYEILNDGAVFRDVRGKVFGWDRVYRIYARGQYLDYKAFSNSSRSANGLQIAMYGATGSASTPNTYVLWDTTGTTDGICLSVSKGYFSWTGSDNYYPSVAFNEAEVPVQYYFSFPFGAGVTMGNVGACGGGASLSNRTVRVGFTKDDGTPTTAEARAAANMTYQDLLSPITVGKLGEGISLNNVPGITANLNPINAYTDTWVNFSGVYTDNDEGIVYFNITANGVHKASETRSFLASGSSASWVVDPANWSKNDNLTFKITAYDGTLYNTTTINITVLNYAPIITNYNVSSLNRTLLYNNTQSVTFAENETARFATTINDPDNEPLTYSWWLNNAWQTFTTFFDKAFNFLSAGNYNVTVYVNDTQNTTSQYWNVQVDSKLKEAFTVDFENPTPTNNTNLPSTTINISFTITPYTTQTPQPAEIAHNTQAQFNGTHSNTEYNTTQQALQLTAGSLNGTYTSAVLDLGGNVGWKNLTWTETEPRAGLATEAGQVALWRMDETSWTGTPNEVTDSSGQGNHGYSFSSATTTSTAMFNRSGNFPGNQNDYIYTNKSGFPSGSAARTMEAWIKTSENFSNTYAGILAYGVSANNQYSALAIYDNKIYFDSGGDAARAVIGTATINDGKWHHAAFTLLSNGSGTLYVDGQVDKTKVFTTMNTDVANGDSRIGHYTLAGISYAFKGQIDDAAIWNKTINSTEIQTHYRAKISALNVEIRSCDDPVCSGETYTAPYTDGTLNTLTLPNNRYIQYRANLGTNDQDYNPQLTAITIKGDTIPPTPTYTPGSAWIELDGTNYTDLSSSNNHYSKTFTLTTGTHTYTAHANNTYVDHNHTETRTANVPPYNITFNITSGENGIGLNSTTITCNYTGFQQAGNTTNPYGPFQYPPGNWQCTFTRTGWYTKTQTFTADNNRVINVVMEVYNQLTIQEHDWLRELYECVIGGDCTAYKYLASINTTVNKIWVEYLPTDKSVVANELITSRTLGAGQNITINYTLNIPFKEGYSNGELLPVRIFYWFTDLNNQSCYSQDKQNDANNAGSPYCVPLIATYLGPNNGTVNFTAVLVPNIPYGTYNLVRQIDIDPIESGKQTWKTYGREKIAQITLLAPNTNNPVTEAKQTGQTIAKTLNNGMNAITGAATGITSSSLLNSLLLLSAMVCLTIILVSYFKYNKSKL